MKSNLKNRRKYIRRLSRLKKGDCKWMTSMASWKKGIAKFLITAFPQKKKQHEGIYGRHESERFRTIHYSYNFYS